MWTWLSLITSATLCGAAGVLYASLSGPSLTFGGALLLPAFAAVFLGSTQLSPGRVNVWGTLIALYALATGIKGLQLVTGVQWLPDMFNGVALLTAVSFAIWRRQRHRLAVLVDDVIWGCVSQSGEQTMDIARNAVLAAGWPERSGVTLDRQCGSSQQSVHFGAAGLIAGQYDVVVAGGVESMSRVPMFSSSQGADPLGCRFLVRYGVAHNQGMGAEMIAERWGLSRQQLDEFSLASHEKAASAQDDGRFEAQIAPVTLDDAVKGRLAGLAAMNRHLNGRAGRPPLVPPGGQVQVCPGLLILSF